MRSCLCTAQVHCDVDSFGIISVRYVRLVMCGYVIYRWCAVSYFPQAKDRIKTEEELAEEHFQNLQDLEVSESVLVLYWGSIDAYFSIVEHIWQFHLMVITRTEALKIMYLLL